MLMRDDKSSSAIQEGMFKHSMRELWTDVGNTGLTLLPKLEIQVLGAVKVSEELTLTQPWPYLGSAEVLH